MNTLPTIIRGLGLAFCLALLPGRGLATEFQVTISADFPGGNVLVKKNAGSVVHLAPDLRGGRPWFYWHFEAVVSQPGRVTFVFADPPKVGVRGPAVSHDGGWSWQWLGSDHVQYGPPPSGADPAARCDAFHYDFAEAKRPVRFAVAIPYLECHLNAFLKEHAGNPHLVQAVLTKSRQGRAVELLQIGKPGPQVQAALVTARHHACESMASYVLEGFLQEAMAESAAGAEFRRQYVLYAVPMVDKDGVQAGDQGKNRSPHDHNRDYGPNPIYPEIKAIQELAEARHVRFALDLHCPALRGEVHETFYFDGQKVPSISNNVNELMAWLGEERPSAIGGVHNFMKQPPPTAPIENMPFSAYFAYRPHIVLAATLEVPYTQPACPLDAAMARKYGQALLKAWVRTRFITAAQDPSRGDADHAGLRAFRAEFERIYRGKPLEAEQAASSRLESAAALSPYRAEANLRMAMLRRHQRRFAEALGFCDAVSHDAGAATGQHVAEAVLRTQIVGSDPRSTADDVEACLAEFLRIDYPAPGQLAKVYEAADDFYRGKQDYERALRYAQKQLPVAPRYETGKTLNRIAAIYDQLHQKDLAVASRKDAVRVLRQRLDPVPPGIFGAMMAGDLFEALQGIPTATLEEKRQCAALVLNHPVSPAALREKVRKALADLQQK